MFIQPQHIQVILVRWFNNLLKTNGPDYCSLGHIRALITWKKSNSRQKEQMLHFDLVTWQVTHIQSPDTPWKYIKTFNNVCHSIFKVNRSPRISFTEASNKNVFFLVGQKLWLTLPECLYFSYWNILINFHKLFSLLLKWFYIPL